jgi:CBS domain-containing membrane protein
MNGGSGRVERSTNEREDPMLPTDARVKDLMTVNVTTLGRNDTLDLADNVMTLDRIRHLPVLDEGRVIGVVSQRDLFRSALATALGYGEKGQKMLLKTLRVKEVMSEPAITIAPEATVKEAARLMVEHKIGCLPVVERATLVGIVTETDVLRYLVNS